MSNKKIQNKIRFKDTKKFGIFMSSYSHYRKREYRINEK